MQIGWLKEQPHEQQQKQRADCTRMSTFSCIESGPLCTIRELFTRGFCNPPSNHSTAASTVATNNTIPTLPRLRNSFSDDFDADEDDDDNSMTATIPTGLFQDSNNLRRQRVVSFPEISTTTNSGFEPTTIILHPYQNLKKALQHGFCDPHELFANCGKSNFGSDKAALEAKAVTPPPALDALTENMSMLSGATTTQSIVEGVHLVVEDEKRKLKMATEAALAAGENDESYLFLEDSDVGYSYESGEDDERMIVLVTYPGVGRMVKVQRAMERFLSAVLILCLTLRSLYYLDNHLVEWDHTAISHELGEGDCFPSHRHMFQIAFAARERQ